MAAMKKLENWFSCLWVSIHLIMPHDCAGIGGPKSFEDFEKIDPLVKSPKWSMTENFGRSFFFSKGTQVVDLIRIRQNCYFYGSQD